MTHNSNTGLKGISAKHVEGGIIGFNVSVQWRNVKLYEWVPVTGTVHAALQRSIQTRATFERQLGKPRTENFIIGTAVGVTLHPRDSVWGAPSWQAYIEVEGVKMATSFSTEEHGKVEARKRALDWRRQKEIELHGAAFGPAEPASYWKP